MVDKIKVDETVREVLKILRRKRLISSSEGLPYFFPDSLPARDACLFQGGEEEPAHFRHQLRVVHHFPVETMGFEKILQGESCLMIHTHPRKRQASATRATATR